MNDARDFVNFDPVTGIIRRIVRSNQIDCLPGYVVALYDPGHGVISDLTHRVDLAALIPDHDGNLCVGRFLARAPEALTIEQLRRARATELAVTDSFVAPPDDRPDGAALRAAWLPYRQALRALGQLATAGEWLRAWPLRPDGADPIARWRGR